MNLKEIKDPGMAIDTRETDSLNKTFEIARVTIQHEKYPYNMM
jgi:hypothetical protein